MGGKDKNSGGRRLTLARLAERLGVSRSTVSNAYNRPDQLSPELRERILREARELGYAGPHPAARALSWGRSGVVGMVFTEEMSFAFSDPAAVMVLQGLARACEEAGVGLLLLPVAPGCGDDARVVENASVDGLVIYSMPDDDLLVEAALDRGLPTVLIDQPRIDGVPFVGIDDRQAAREATSHLLELGHERLGIVVHRLDPDRLDATVEPSRIAAARYRTNRARLAGYREALEEAGLGWNEVWIEERSANTLAAGHDAAASLLDCESRPTALLTDSDLLAIGALRAARERGVAVPGQLSVVGVDDIPEASTSVPALTTIHQPLFDKGLAAGRQLVRPSRGGYAAHEEETLLLPIELVVRGSTAPPAYSPAPKVG